ncbi:MULTISPECIES: phosphoribosyltransferase [Comamonas]|uniref:phosphoribosyltransferase n=1 Tax=Comamonas TaxID=283 RepID=UPI000B30CD8F|nr:MULTISPECIES: phosphoribosyltransferase [Comamonas]
MSLKLVLISPSGSIIKGNKYLEDAINELANAIKEVSSDGVRFAVWSNQYYTLTSDPSKNIADLLSEKSGVAVDYIQATKNGLPPRQSKNSVAPILAKYNVSLHETILVGATRTDLFAGVNNKLLLLRPTWYQEDMEYGFKLEKIRDLARFCKIFGARQHSFFWRVNSADAELNVFALGPFSTYKPEYAYIGSDALQAAKFEAGTKDFWSLLTISTLYFSGVIHKINMITVYPGHSDKSKDKIYYESLDLLGKCFNIPFTTNLILRHTTALKSTSVGANNRKFSTQLSTIHLNKKYGKYKKDPPKNPAPIKGKQILVIDDMCTSGKSLECARQYLQAAGANVTLFSWLKTINTPYTAISPAINIDPYKKNEFQGEPQSIDYGYHENIVNAQAADEIKRCLQDFQAWK